MAPDVDQVRLDARARLAAVFTSLIEEGVAAGELPGQDARLGGAAIVGAFLEGVVGPLSSRAQSPPVRGAVARGLARFCQAAVGGPREQGETPAAGTEEA
jgi:AcrR family transcriptional regulator